MSDEDAAQDVTRRQFMTTTGKLSAVTAAGLMFGKLGAGASGTLSPLVAKNAVDLSNLIRTKRVSCREVMTAYLDQIDRFNPKVNAIVSLQSRDGLMQQADERDQQLAKGDYKGWMHGFPHAVKDLAATKGIRTTQGSPLTDTVPQKDALFVERLKRSGAIIIGKTNAPEFGLGSQTYNPIFGTTLNAYSQSKCAGGSSGGAAVSLALRMVPVADGSDMMGSLRNPAAFNNVIGFRPSIGRVPSGGDEELFFETLSTSGAMGRSVTDVAMLLSVMAGPDARRPFSIEENPAQFAEPLKRDFKGTRLGWMGNYNGYLAMEPRIMELCEHSFKAFESIGCSVESVQPEFPPERIWQSWLTLRHWLTAGDLGMFYKDPAKREKLKPEAQWEVEGGLNLTATEVYAASETRSEWYRAMGKLFDTYDYLLLPTAQVFPFDAQMHWPKEINGKKMDTYHRWMEVVIGGSLSGHPVINVPVGFNPAGLPMGMQIIGKNHADLAVLQIAYAYEQATNWVANQLPPLLQSA